MASTNAVSKGLPKETTEDNFSATPQVTPLLHHRGATSNQHIQDPFLTSTNIHLEDPPKEPTEDNLPVLPPGMQEDPDFTELWNSVRAFYIARDDDKGMSNATSRVWMSR